MEVFSCFYFIFILHKYNHKLSLPWVIHILHRVFHIHFFFYFQYLSWLLDFFNSFCILIFNSRHLLRLIYITFLFSSFSPFIILFLAGQGTFCKYFLRRFQKKQVQSLHIHFLRGNMQNTTTGVAGGCHQTGIALCSSRTR